MVEKRNDMKNLIDEAIDASIKFEELMDKTDFDSWFDNLISDSIEKEKNFKHTVNVVIKNEIEK